MRRTGVCVSLFQNSAINKILSEFLQPLRDFRTCATWVGQTTGCPRSIMVSFWFVFGEFLVGCLWLDSRQTTGVPVLSSTLKLDTGTGEVSLSVRSSLSRASLTVTWCCCRWWRRRAWGRCRTMPLLSWKCHWSWRMRTGGSTRWQAWNHDRNEVLRVALYPNPV